MGTCSECNGTGMVDLLTSRRPCYTCGRKKGSRKTKGNYVAAPWEDVFREYMRTPESRRKLLGVRMSVGVHKRFMEWLKGPEGRQYRHLFPGYWY